MLILCDPNFDENKKQLTERTLQKSSIKTQF